MTCAQVGRVDRIENGTGQLSSGSYQQLTARTLASATVQSFTKPTRSEIDLLAKKRGKLSLNGVLERLGLLSVG